MSPLRFAETEPLRTCISRASPSVRQEAPEASARERRCRRTSSARSGAYERGWTRCPRRLASRSLSRAEELARSTDVRTQREKVLGRRPAAWKFETWDLPQGKYRLLRGRRVQRADLQKFSVIDSSTLPRGVMVLLIDQRKAVPVPSFRSQLTRNSSITETKKGEKHAIYFK